MADTTTIEALKKKHNKAQNVRKALNVLAFVAPLTTAVPDALTGANGAMKQLSADWTPWESSRLMAERSRLTCPSTTSMAWVTQSLCALT